MFQLLTGTKMNHVPYKGAAPAVADLLPGRIQVWIGAANTLLPHIKDGRLRLLGDSPTIAQSVPGYSLDPWLGLFVPAKTPAPVVQRIHAEVTKIVNARSSSPSSARRASSSIPLAAGIRALHSRRPRALGQGHSRSRYQG